MVTKILPFVLSILTFANFALAETQVVDGVTFSLKAANDGSSYKIGDTAEFKFSATKDGKPLENLEIKCRTSKEGEALQRKIAKLDKGEFSVTRKLDEAGFLRCEILPIGYKNSKGGALTLVAGAAFEPLKIKKSLPKPTDFDKFWSEQIDLLQSVPMNLQMREVKSPNKNVKVFDIRADTTGVQLSGYLALPAIAKEKTLPAIILPHGAGVRSSSLSHAALWAASGFIALDFNSHGLPNGMDSKFYKRIGETSLRQYFYFNTDDKYSSYMTAMYTRVYRALEVVMSMKEWNGKDLIANGTSQGGTQAIVAAALCDKLTYAVIAVPGMCDNTAFKVGRAVGGGWFAFRDGKVLESSAEPSRYIDSANFAENIKCPTLWCISYADTTCVPSSCFAAYNCVKAPKKVIVNEESGHAIPPQRYGEFVLSIREKVFGK